jgi:polyferredoxin
MNNSFLIFGIFYFVVLLTFITFAYFWLEISFVRNNCPYSNLLSVPFSWNIVFHSKGLKEEKNEVKMRNSPKR